MSLPAAPNIGLATRLRRSLRRDPGLFFMPALLIVSLAITVAIHPQFSDFDLQSLAMGALPLAFAAAAQAVVVISGGIDLSIGSAMAVANVLAASAMEKSSFPQSLLLALAVLLAGAIIASVINIGLAARFISPYARAIASVKEAPVISSDKPGLVMWPAGGWRPMELTFNPEEWGAVVRR